MSSFISKEDYQYQIRTYKLDQILEVGDEDDYTILNAAENEALGMIEKHLADKYDIPTVFAQSGSNRNAVIMRWAKVLVMYYIYERIPDEMVPERIVANYKEVMLQLKRIEDGAAGVPGLPPKVVTDGNGETANYTRRRFGSNAMRTHDGLSPRDKT
jgi:phage gp36-like protein